MCNVRDYCTASVVQHVLGMLLALTHRLREYDALGRSGAWQRGEAVRVLDCPIRELAGRTLGMVGLRRARPGVAPRGAERARHGGAGREPPGRRAAPGRVDLDELLPQVDVLRLHCPLTPATDGLIGALELAGHEARRGADQHGARRAGGLAGAGGRTARAPLGGAAIDVLPRNRRVDGNPLFADDMPNLIVTPHIAWAAREARQRCLDEMAANVEDFRRGGRRGRVV